MLNKNNAYFEEIRRIGHEWEAAREERRARKQTIIDTFGWDSDELKAWYAEDAAATFPISQGVSKAYRAWWTSIDRNQDEVEMDDFLWDKEIKDYLETLKKAGITTFLYANESTSAMENMRDFLRNNCTMDGAKTITRKEHRWGQDEDEEIFGIHFTIC